MSYYLGKVLSIPFEDAVARTTEALKTEGFGILTEIDVTQTLKKKIGVDFPSYRILGACNPALAYEALKLENKVGTMLPCNVVVRPTTLPQVEPSGASSGGYTRGPALTGLWMAPGPRPARRMASGAAPIAEL